MPPEGTTSNHLARRRDFIKNFGDRHQFYVGVNAINGAGQ